MIRYDSITDAPGWLVRETRLPGGDTSIQLLDPLGNERGFRVTDDKHDIQRLVATLLDQPGVMLQIGTGHELGDQLTAGQTQQIELHHLLQRVQDSTLSVAHAAEQITLLFKALP